MFEDLRNWTQSRFLSKYTVLVDETSAGARRVGPVLGRITEDRFVNDADGRAIAYFNMSQVQFDSLRDAQTAAGQSDFDFAKQYASIDPDIMPVLQWSELGPQAVYYTASLIYKYFKDVGGRLPCSNCYQFTGTFLSNSLFGGAPWLAKGTPFSRPAYFRPLEGCPRCTYPCLRP